MSFMFNHVYANIILVRESPKGHNESQNSFFFHFVIDIPKLTKIYKSDTIVQAISCFSTLYKNHNKNIMEFTEDFTEN